MFSLKKETTNLLFYSCAPEEDPRRGTKRFLFLKLFLGRIESRLRGNEMAKE